MSLPGYPEGVNPDPFLHDWDAANVTGATVGRYLDRVRRTAAECGENCAAVAADVLRQVRERVAEMERDARTISDELIGRAAMLADQTEATAKTIGAKIAGKVEGAVTQQYIQQTAAGGWYPPAGYDVGADLTRDHPSPYMASQVGGMMPELAQALGEPGTLAPVMSPAATELLQPAPDTVDPTVPFCPPPFTWNPQMQACEGNQIGPPPPFGPPPPPPPPPPGPPVGDCPAAPPPPPPPPPPDPDCCPPGYSYDHDRQMCVLYTPWSWENGGQQITASHHGWGIEIDPYNRGGSIDCAYYRAFLLASPLPGCQPCPPGQRRNEAGVCVPVGPPPPPPPPPPPGGGGVCCPTSPIIVQACCPTSPPPPPPPPPCVPKDEGPSEIHVVGVTIPSTRKDAQRFYDEHAPTVVETADNSLGRYTYFRWDNSDSVKIGYPAEPCPPHGPPPPPGQVGPEYPGFLEPVKLPEDDDPEWCARLKELTSRDLSDAGACSPWDDSLRQLFLNPDEETIWSNLKKSLVEPWGSNVFGSVIDGLAQAYCTSSKWLGEWQTVPPAITVEVGALLAGVGFVQQWAGGPWEYLFQPARYTLQYSYPTMRPTQTPVDAMYLADLIQKETWTCYTRANGNLPNVHYLAMYANRARPNIAEEIAWGKRTDKTDAEIFAAVRKLGVLEGEEFAKWMKLFEQIPALGSLMRYMIRDVENPQAVQDDGLYQGFEQNWRGRIQEWGKQQGISDEFALREWAAHWILPNPTQLYQMLRRLRPDKYPVGMAVTRDLVERMIRQNDMAPNFVKRLVEISYDPITRSDLIKGFNGGQIGKPELKERLQDVGYSVEDAARLADVLDAQRKRQLITTTGGWTPRALMTAYRQGSISRDTAAVYMAEYIDDLALINNLLDQADSQREAESRAACVKGIKNRFMFGEFGTLTATEELINLGLEGGPANTLVAGWTCARQSRRKQPAVAQIKTWWKRHIIGTNDVIERLTNLGYVQGDIESFLRVWQMELTEQQLKALKAAEKEAEQKRRQAIADAKAAAPCRDTKPPCNPPPPKPKASRQTSSAKGSSSNGVHG